MVSALLARLDLVLSPRSIYQKDRDRAGTFDSLLPIRPIFRSPVPKAQLDFNEDPFHHKQRLLTEAKSGYFDLRYQFSIPPLGLPEDMQSLRDISHVQRIFRGAVEIQGLPPGLGMPDTLDAASDVEVDDP